MNNMKKKANEYKKVAEMIDTAQKCIKRSLDTINDYKESIKENPDNTYYNDWIEEEENEIETWNTIIEKLEAWK